MNKSFITRELNVFIKNALAVFPFITLTGPRQSGKTTLTRLLFPELQYVNLEDAFKRQELMDDVKVFFVTLP